MPLSETFQHACPVTAARRLAAGSLSAPPSRHAPPEEALLIRKAQAGDAAARERLVTANRGLIYSVARRYSCRSLAREDLVQEAVIGFLSAIDSFDASLGLRLASFAVPCMQNAILDAIERSDRIIRLPSNAGATLRALRALRKELR